MTTSINPVPKQSTAKGLNSFHPVALTPTLISKTTQWDFPISVGFHITEDLSWTVNTSTLVKVAHQHLFLETQEGPSILSDSGEYLWLRNLQDLREPSYQLHHSMVLQLLCLRPESTADHGDNWPTPVQEVSAEGAQHHCRHTFLHELNASPSTTDPLSHTLLQISAL